MMKSIISCIIIGIFIAGCSTTGSLVRLAPDYSDLPADELRTLATQIETIVSQGEAEFLLESPGGIMMDSPEMKQAIRTRSIRHPLLFALLDTGFATEGRNGLIAIKRSSAYKKATTSRQRDREAMLVMSENSNRWTLYEGLVEANGWAPGNLSAVQETFFQARVPLMGPGQQHAPVE
jgi:hypothetical protein